VEVPLGTGVPEVSVDGSLVESRLGLGLGLGVATVRRQGKQRNEQCACECFHAGDWIDVVKIF